MLSHLRDSGDLEQTADQVIFLHRKDYYDPEQAQRNGSDNISELILARNRAGQVATARVFYHKHLSRMHDLDAKHTSV